MEAEEFCCMFTTKFEGTTILYGAEMDGIESAGEFTDTDVNDLTFVELKVRMKPSNQRQMDNFYRFKTINWWCQSHLANVQKIVVGLRNQAGIVDALETMDVESLPKMSEVNDDFVNSQSIEIFVSTIAALLVCHHLHGIFGQIFRHGQANDARHRLPANRLQIRLRSQSQFVHSMSTT